MRRLPCADDVPEQSGSLREAEQVSARAYWERSWQTVEPARIAVYRERLASSSDACIRYLKARGHRTVCDAGCGCGAYSLALAAAGFQVSGFDVSADAVSLAATLLSENGYATHGFRLADILSTGFADGQFDAVVARDVIDHMPLQDGKAAAAELLRITKPGGSVLLTLDQADEEYESEPHETSPDGDYRYTGGKWNGMVFHPYSPEEISRLVVGQEVKFIHTTESGFLAVFEKSGGSIG